jgi:hypothetical protein
MATGCPSSCRHSVTSRPHLPLPTLLPCTARRRGNRPAWACRKAVRERMGGGVDRSQQFFEPELFGAVVGNVIVGVILRVAFGQSGLHPVGGLVNGAGVTLRVAEAFGQQGPITVVAFPLAGEFPQPCPRALTGRIGAARRLQDQETPQWHHQLPLLPDQLAELITGLPARPQPVLPSQRRLGLPPLRCRMRHFHLQFAQARRVGLAAPIALRFHQRIPRFSGAVV